MKNFILSLLKGFTVGLGAIAPGLSGSMLLVIFGLYQKIVDTVSHIFKNFLKNILFLMPLGIGLVAGVLVFAKLVSIPLDAYPMQTYYAFLGLVLGTLPALWCEVRKEGFKKRYYAFMGGAFALSALFFIIVALSNPSGDAGTAREMNFPLSVLLGLAVSCAYLIPGVDSFAILSTLGLYKTWMGALDELDFKILLPAAIGLVIGGVTISLIFNKLLSKFYTGTYSIVFGLFIAVILNFTIDLFTGINDGEVSIPAPGLNIPTLVSFILLLLGFAFSLVFSRLENIVKYIRSKRSVKAGASSQAPSCEATECADAVLSSEDDEATEAEEEGAGSSEDELPALCETDSKDS